MSEELKPCPFCGSSDLAVMELLSRGFRIECQGCGAYSPIKKDGPSLLHAWNTRVDDSQATRAALVSEIVAWLRSDEEGEWMIADEIEAEWGNI